MRYRSVFRAGLFDGQRIVVTGGGSGIGRCCAHELASLGAHVALVGRNPAKLATVAEEVEGQGGIRPTWRNRGRLRSGWRSNRRSNRSVNCRPRRVCSTSRRPFTTASTTAHVFW